MVGYFYHLFWLPCERTPGINLPPDLTLFIGFSAGGGITWWRFRELAHCSISGIGGNLWVASRPQVITQTPKPLFSDFLYLIPGFNYWGLV